MKEKNRPYIKIKKALCENKKKARKTVHQLQKIHGCEKPEKSAGVQNITSISNLATQENLRRVKTTTTIIIF